MGAFHAAVARKAMRTSLFTKLFTNLCANHASALAASGLVAGFPDPYASHKPAAATKALAGFVNGRVILSPINGETRAGYDLCAGFCIHHLGH